MEYPSVFKRLIACCYELLLLIAIWMVCVAIFIALFGATNVGIKRFMLQLVLWLVSGLYFFWCWRKTGQTPAMKTWRLKLVNQKGLPPSDLQLISRYIIASLGLLLMGAGFVWALVDREHLFLHDRMTGCRTVLLRQA